MLYLNRKSANESISKYKLLTAYGGPGSIVHTQYGSIIISCIEEWGFLNKVEQLNKRAINQGKNDNQRIEYVVYEAREKENGGIGISNDDRLLKALKKDKELINLEFLVLVPDIEVATHNNKINDEGERIAIPSSYMPKVFLDNNQNYKAYNKWHREWIGNSDNNDPYGTKFHPPKFILNNNSDRPFNLRQDNIVLICEHGHISDFPWSKFLRWRVENPTEIYDEAPANVFSFQDCCDSPKIKISSNTANASGFDGKWLGCRNCGKGKSLKGLMNVKIKCPGHKPWESETFNDNSNYPYSGNFEARSRGPKSELCFNDKPMKVVLTTGNNIYYSRIKSSIFLHDELFQSPLELKINELELRKNQAIIYEDFMLAQDLKREIDKLSSDLRPEESLLPDSQLEVEYRYQEFQAFHQDESLLNKQPRDLKVKDVTDNLRENKQFGVDGNLEKYFERILRIDNLKITSAQLDFSRVVPIDADAENVKPKNIFRNNKEDVIVYPAVENFGEGIFFSFNKQLIDEFSKENPLLIEFAQQLNKLQQNSNDFSKGAIDFAVVMNWQLYLVHTFAHLVMRELEFRCGYPTASLSERIYVSNDADTQMYGCLIYTAEGAEGSMGGIIAQTRPLNLNNLLKSALLRATICNSDPLCWESEGQGLFDLNFSSCFSCSLVSETSCEYRNLYLDRKLLVDEKSGFFKDLVTL